jgi:hypothetical protein
MKVSIRIQLLLCPMGLPDNPIAHLDRCGFLAVDGKGKLWVSPQSKEIVDVPEYLKEGRSLSQTPQSECASFAGEITR